MARVLLFSYWPVFTPEGMACSVGLRVWGLAQTLSALGHQVRIAEPQNGRAAIPPPPVDCGVEMVGWGHPRASRAMIEAADVVVAPAAPLMLPHFKHARPRCLVVDLYAPILLEAASFMERTEAELASCAVLVRCLLFFLRRGDAFLCAGERQRHLYIGALASTGRLNPLMDPSQLLLSVPMGTDTAPPVPPPAPVLRGHRVPLDAELVLWPGGIYPWFDALTVVRAFARVYRERPRAVLMFLGATNPLAGGLTADGPAGALREARRLGLPERAVQFAPWLPYHERAAMYYEADLAVTAHQPLPEAEFSWRTRTLDCLWGGLPMVLTEGDELGELAQSAGAAVCVPMGDAAALAGAIGALLADPERRARMRLAARRLATETLSWDRLVEPLHALCRSPRPAPDRADPVLNRWLNRAFVPCPAPGASSMRLWAGRVQSSFRCRGPLGSLRHIAERVFSQARLSPSVHERRPWANQEK
jgi:glycosyltransferase involved in cell wall biosynthesis